MQRIKKLNKKQSNFNMFILKKLTEQNTTKQWEMEMILNNQ